LPDIHASFSSSKILPQTGCKYGGKVSYADLPVIFMTGYDESEHMAKAFASGGVDYIVKPIQFQEMFARIKVHLSNARRARSARDALDRTGRRMIACREDGSIAWTPPQAADLMQRNGLRAGDGDSLPGDVRFWLTTVGESSGSDQQPTISVTRGDSQEGVAFRLLDQEETGEFLLHLVDLGQGTDEVRLSRTLGLSVREAEVLVWIAHGKSNNEIAELLELSPRTMNKHLEQIFNKLGVENRTAAATRATRVLMDWR
jgi:DNA-binding NarL/FixJ family response regulator